MSKQKARILGHIIYWFVVCMWALLIPIFFYNEIQRKEINAQEIRINNAKDKYDAMIADIKQRPYTDWFEYFRIEAKKETIEYWEPMEFISHREIKENMPYITLDQVSFSFYELLFCNYGKWEWFARVDPARISNWIKPKTFKLVSPPRRHLGSYPYYKPAECYLYSKICIEVEGIEKCQYL